MTLRIIDHKRIDLTSDEYDLYLKIVASYTNPPYQKGEDLFIDLFETDDNGLIIFLKPPSKRQTSMEIFLFLSSLMLQQHLRASVNEFNTICKKMQDRINILDAKLAELNRG